MLPDVIVTALPAVDALYQLTPVLATFANRFVMWVAAVRVAGRAVLLQEFGAQTPFVPTVQVPRLQVI